MLMERPGLAGAALAAALSDATDAWLRQLLGEEEGVALVAVGGYGRAQLCPHSDLDLLLLHRNRRDARPIADRLWYPIWDQGLSLDHSVRTVKEALSVAGSDLKVLLGLLDARHVAGDRTLSHEVVAGARHAWAKRPGHWLGQVALQVEGRRARFGDVAHLLEPDLKESFGGLRDAAGLRAAALAGFAPPLPDSIAAATELLVAVRVELHRRSSRPTDLLSLDQQDAVASALGVDADELMARVSAAGRDIGWSTNEVFRLARGPKRSRREQRLGPDLILQDGEIGLAPDADPRSDPTLCWRAAVEAARVGVAISHTALRRLAAEQTHPSEPWSAQLRGVVVDLLGAGPSLIPPWEALDAVGLVHRFLPEWEPVRSRPQRNAYHRFTVDRHLLEAVARVDATGVARRDLLLVGTLLHDIGKGYPGDHTEAGIDVAARVMERMGFGDADSDVVASLIRHHLLLPDVATRRDIDDPRTIDLVAEAVGDVDTLRMLAALTEADGQATGPAAWSDWKGQLVLTLVEAVTAAMAGRPRRPADLLNDVDRALLTGSGRTVEVQGSTVVVVGEDRPGLLSRVAGALAVNGVSVRSARVASAGGRALQRFTLTTAMSDPGQASRLEGDIDRALDGRLAINARLKDRVAAYALNRSQAARPVATEIAFDDEAAHTATIIEVRTADRPGVLYRITRALADCDLDVSAALVSTVGGTAVDAFYVTDGSGGQLLDDDHRREVERAVRFELDG